MPSTLTCASVALAFASLVCAQYGGGYGPYQNNPSGNSGYGPFGSYSYASFISIANDMVTAHAVLATLAFGFFFPVGSIMIRIASFPGLWWVHGAFQIFAYMLYIAAAAIGINLAINMGVMNQYHPIIGIVLLVVLLFQPFLGFLHHSMFKKHNRRVVWSYTHIWLGRIAITLGIVNGGLGLLFATQNHFFAPSQGAIIGYAVAAGIIWLIYVLCAIYGESKRGGNSAKGDIVQPPPYKERPGRHERRQYA